jgi:pyruvate dehydrogenase E2 component (dihydrolipoamide acetyltransferase)
MTGRVFNLPDLGEGLEEAEISAWLVTEGDEVELNQPLVEVETAKAVVEIPSPFAGVVVQIHVAPGSTLSVGAPLVTIQVDEAEVAGVAGEAPAPPARPHLTPSAPNLAGLPRPTASSAVAATPAVRALAKSRGVDLSTLDGTGAGGRVTREDVEGAARAVTAERGGDVEVIRISPVRRAIADNLMRAVREVPQVTTWRTVDCSALEAFRTGLGVSPLPVVVKALAEVCLEHRWLNGSYLAETGEIHLYRGVHVSIATDTERGLLVPVLRDAQDRGVTEIGAEIGRLADLARAGGLAPADMAGGTITVTNTGSYGSEAGTPILNPPQGAILALGVIEPRALVVDGRVEARPACTMSLTFDHRLLDGATAGRAFGALVEILEDPGRLAALR